MTPKHLSLGPHENKHVTLIFRPQAIQRYSASFRAIVDRAVPDATFTGLSFDLRGEGTLPTISLEVLNGLAPLPPSRGVGQPSPAQAVAPSGGPATGGTATCSPLLARSIGILILSLNRAETMPSKYSVSYSTCIHTWICVHAHVLVYLLRLSWSGSRMQRKEV